MENKHNEDDCPFCKGTGKIKYKPIEIPMYSWQPWLIRNCSNCKGTGKRASQ